MIEKWNGVCDEADLSEVDRACLWGRQFLNPFAFDDLSGDAAHLKTMADDARA
jgi:serine/threonine-protein kinase HipA